MPFIPWVLRTSLGPRLAIHLCDTVDTERIKEKAEAICDGCILMHKLNGGPSGSESPRYCPIAGGGRDRGTASQPRHIIVRELCEEGGQEGSRRPEGCLEAAINQSY
jgi:hypothetical protein